LGIDGDTSLNIGLSYLKKLSEHKNIPNDVKIFNKLNSHIELGKERIDQVTPELEATIAESLKQAILKKCYSGKS
jgi:hypothetical protein